jgi:DNA repair protein SbcC/Rad50
MIPVNLSIAGFLSYAEKVEIDFSEISLACISGANGAGKSSLLDAITWVLFGKARQRDESLINSHRSQAEVILVFDYENARYRVQRIKQKEKPAVLEFAVQMVDGSWKTLSENTVKKTEDAIVNTLRMDFETFTNASFFLQGKADEFAQQNPTNRKRILASILNLDQWEIYRERVNFRRTNLKNEQNLIDQEVTQIETEMGEADFRRSEEKRLLRESALVAEQRKTRERSLEVVKQKEALLEQKKEQALALHAQLDPLGEKIAKAEEILVARRKEEEGFRSILANSERINSSYTEHLIKIEQQKIMATLEGKAHTLALEKQDQEAVLAQEKALLQKELEGLEKESLGISKTKSDRMEIQKNLDKVSTQFTLLENRISTRDSVEINLAKVKDSLAEVISENKGLRKEMDELQGKLEEIEATHDPNCPLCGQPLSPEHRKKLITDMKKDGKTKGDQFRVNEGSRKKLEEEKIALEKDLVEIKKDAEEKNKLQKQLAQLETLEKTANEKITEWETPALRLKEIQTQLKENQFALAVRKKLAGTESQIQKLGYDHKKHDSLREEVEAGVAIEAQKNELDKALAADEPLQRSIEEMETRLKSDETDRDRIAEDLQKKQKEITKEEASKPEFAALEEEVVQYREKENQLTLELGAARQKVSVLKDLEKRKQTITKNRDQIAHQVTLLTRLDKAFGKDGIPALLIEQALPEIEERANEILDRLSAGGMSVRFQTQKEFKDKKRDDKKETLDIVISDASGPREYELFSGGEAFRVNFAIRLALSHLLAQRAGARLRTLVIDEGFGSQDADGRQRLIEAINLVHTDFEKILVITHLEELKDAFPSRIEVEKTLTGSQVKVVNG